MNRQPIKGYSRAHSFEEWFFKNTDEEKRRDIRRHGMNGACPGGMIYYCDIAALYNAYFRDIWDIVLDDDQSLKSVLNDEVDNPWGFMTFMVWYAAEKLAARSQ